MPESLLNLFRECLKIYVAENPALNAGVRGALQTSSSSESISGEITTIVPKLFKKMRNLLKNSYFLKNVLRLKFNLKKCKNLIF